MPNRYYKNAPIVDNLYYGPPDFVFRDFSDIPGKEFTIMEGDRLDILVEQIYGNDPEDWKAIMLYNNLGYFFDLQPGDVIKFPYDIELVKARI